MAYNFLGLVNDVNRRLNEVELTQSNFSSAIGYYSQAKDAVNNSISKINQEQFEWPFNHVTQEDTAVAGTVRYAFQSGAKIVDMDSFRIKRDTALNVTSRKLRIISYEEYLDKFVDADYNTSTQTRSTPQYVFRTPDLKYGLYPAPDKAYTIVYEYYSTPTALSAYSDVPSIPEQYRYVIVEGAMYYAYMFRGDLQSADFAYQRFIEGIKDMKTLLINRFDYLRSPMIIQGNRYAF